LRFSPTFRNSKSEIRKFSNFAPLAQLAEQVTLNYGLYERYIDHVTEFATNFPSLEIRSNIGSIGKSA
jgi:hypothetical protein